MDTLVSLAGQFPLLGPVRDLHPLADIHASQTQILSNFLLLGRYKILETIVVRILGI